MLGAVVLWPALGQGLLGGHVGSQGMLGAVGPGQGLTPAMLVWQGQALLRPRLRLPAGAGPGQGSPGGEPRAGEGKGTGPQAPAGCGLSKGRQSCSSVRCLSPSSVLPSLSLGEAGVLPWCPSLVR